MSKKPSTVGVVLYLINMVIFFVVYYFFSGIQYFDVSMKVNSFVLPVVYCIGAFISVQSYWKGHNGINFREAFKRAFVPMFIGGFLSMASIFVFLNYFDTDAKDLLNHQYVERQKTELDNEYQKAKSILKNEADKKELEQNYQNRLKSFAPDRVEGKDMLTASHFMGYFAVIMVFYVILSLFFGAFFRSRSAK